ncbi:MAG: heparinase [bacterium]|nr:heparinase [bacterium]
MTMRMAVAALGAAVAVCAIAWPAQAGETAVNVVTWADLIDSVREDPAYADARDALVADARKRADLPIVRRVFALEDVGKHRTWLDGRSNALEDEIRETFALAMSDFSACNTLAGELPVLAAAYRLTGDDTLRDRVVAQLDETAAWSPLQRPGWSCYAPGRRLPADGKDGNWLATGCGMRAIGDALDLMPEGSVPPELRERLDALLRAEIDSIVEDWQVKRSWFIRTDNPITNQWVLPTEGLVRACLMLGVDDRREAYELGVANLMKALDAHGPNGEFEEGVGYASFTVTSLVHAAHAMAVSGDRRALDHPFLQRFPLWLVHHAQPGDAVVNCFDSGAGYGAANRLRPLLSLMAATTASPAARWGLEHLCNGPTDDLPGVAARGLPRVGPEAAPPLYAVYERATRVNWRDSWDDAGSGFWLRGGHPTDQHDHQDRGHVNFIANGRPVLIEAGTPSYHNPLMMTHYTTGAGHNVLQLGTEFPEERANAGEHVKLPGWQPRGVVAPITVTRLDETGGEATVTIAGGYDNLAEWRRTAQWTASKLTVVDEVTLQEGAKDVVLFRWHLGTTENLGAIEADVHSVSGEWSTAAIRFSANNAIVHSSCAMPDKTLPREAGDDAEPTHTCILVQTMGPVNALRLTTTVTAK